ncbi:RpnC/YadD family protein [Niabella aquatica]
MNKNKHQFDPIWKSLIEDLFPDFLRFFFHGADKLFGMRKFEFLDKELEKLYPDKETDRNVRFVDKLVKVQWKHSGEQWILVHIEVQGYADKQFAHRMFQYFYRISDRYRRPVTAIAIFSGVQGYSPERYEIELLGTRLEYQYNTYRVIDQEDEMLKRSNNPFALVVLAVKTALCSSKATDEELMSRYEWIFRNWLEKSSHSEKSLLFMRFCRTVFALPILKLMLPLKRK